ncbi:uncharacterized protein LOC123518213 [Portunus trituberculatus]|uniref:uncharacterized protein LOC123518213 n=1 Tax=Portunus trituberculatus TaxID=210409 RepID=UPI001E1D11C8|nr:uncharacterized protein LOC123518213 [Portunus trituberculatus]
MSLDGSWTILHPDITPAISLQSPRHQQPLGAAQCPSVAAAAVWRLADPPSPLHSTPLPSIPPHCVVQYSLRRGIGQWPGKRLYHHHHRRRRRPARFSSHSTPAAAVPTPCRSPRPLPHHQQGFCMAP